MMSLTPKQQQKQDQLSTVVSATRHVDIFSTTNNNTSNKHNANEDDTQNTDTTHSGKLLGRIYLPPDEIDPLALKQVVSMCSHPACTNVRAMPDCCKGNGCTVGFTSQLTQCISPQLIGGDIACGITAIPISKRVVERRNGLERILNVIHDCVPMGGGADGVQKSPAIRLEQYVPFLEEASIRWREFNSAYMQKFGVNLDVYATQKYASYIPPPHEAENINALGNNMQASTSSSSFVDNNNNNSNTPNPAQNLQGKNIAKFQYTVGWLQKRVQEWGITMEQMKCSLLSLGQGNHFVELNQLTFSLDDHSSAMATPPPPSNSASAVASENNQKSSSKKNQSSFNSSSSKKGKGSKNKKNNSYYVNKNHKGNNNTTDASSSDDEDDENNNTNEQPENEDDQQEDDNDELPEYILSCHTGSRAVGQAVYRYWTKKCAQYQQARIQLQMLQQQQQQSGGKLTAEQLQQLAQATATLSSGIGMPPSAKNNNKCSSAKSVTSDICSIGSSPSNAKKQKQQKESSKTSLEPPSPSSTSKKNVAKQLVDNDQHNDGDEQDQEEEEADPNLVLNSFPLPKNDDDESIAFNSGFLLTSPEDLACYYMDVIFAQIYAKMNRCAILSTIFYHLGDKAGKFSEKAIIETVHNYIDFKDFVIRKGAVRAHEGEKVLIGLNMKEGIWLCRGKGNPEWNYSCAHGCGRIKSRSSAAASQNKNSGKGSNKASSVGGMTSKAMKKEDPRIKEFKKEMGEVVSKSVNSETFDERPSVYRNSSLVRSLLDPSVEILCRYKTVLNCKGGN